MFAWTRAFLAYSNTFGLLISLSSINLIAALGTVIPEANGPYGVGSSTTDLTDYTRLDPFSPSHQYRKVMISAFYPAAPNDSCNEKIVDYMPPRTALVEDETYSPFGIPNGTFESLKLSQCDDDCQTIDHVEEFPLVLFSPGLGTSRLLYSAIAQSVASHGFVVVTIDHPYDANVVEFPDGTLVIGSNISPDNDSEVEFTLATRAQDVSFILDQLSSVSNTRRLLPFATASLNTSKVAIYGHSLGGATVATATANDSRIAGGVDLDGSLFGPVINEGFNDPFLLFGREGSNLTADPSWMEIWPHLSGWKLDLELADSGHGTFTDFPILTKSLDLTNDLPPEAVALLGTIDGTRALDITSTYLLAFFRFAFEGVASPLLERSVAAYPEVTIVAK